MKNNKQPGLVTLAVLTALTSILWVFFSVIRVLSDSPASTVPPEILEPIDPNLDLETLRKVQDALVFDQEDSEAIKVEVVQDLANPVTQQASESASLETEDSNFTGDEFDNLEADLQGE